MNREWVLCINDMHICQAKEAYETRERENKEEEKAQAAKTASTKKSPSVVSNNDQTESSTMKGGVGKMIHTKKMNLPKGAGTNKKTTTHIALCFTIPRTERLCFLGHRLCH